MELSPFFAHSADGETSPSTRWQLLRDHLKQVAELAKRLATATGVPDLPAAANAAGWLHDLGKYQLDWQSYLMASAAGLRPSTVPHSIHGAAFAFRQLEHCPLAIAIAGHHSGLPDWPGGEGFEGEIDKKAPPQLVSGLATTATTPAEGCLLPKAAVSQPECEDSEDGMRRLEYWTRMLFSVLIDADRLDTAGRERADRPLDPSRLLDTLREKVPPPKEGASDRLNELRRQVFDGCIAAGSEPRGFFELTVPTGGGKTRSGMAFALAHATKHELRRVFVVIPYLSIIEQNAREYRELFGGDVVLEHHSAVVADDKPMKGESYRSLSQTELATENWDSPVVVTTSVQFLETLLAANTRRCRRLHSVARSVILFDEAQCLPAHLLNPLLDVFRELTTNYGCSVVFSTATQPAFRCSATGLTCGLKERERKQILDETLRTELYRDLKRVTYTNRTATPWEWGALVGELVKGPALCVLNTRKHARMVWELLREQVDDKSSVRHLSSSLCAQHRLDILGKRTDEPGTGSIYARLKAGLSCWVVSTQVIEAGVDISFPKVFRALGPLDSIVQAGGRCNREGELKDATGNPLLGEVVIFQPVDDKMPNGIYQIATGEAKTILGEVSAEKLVTDPDVFAKYFTTVFNRTATDPHDIQKMRAEWKFDSVADAAKVIDDGGRAVIVPYQAAKKHVRALRKLGTFDRRSLRALQRYTVNLRENDFRKGRETGLITPLLPASNSGRVPEQDDSGPWVLAEGSYHEDLGVMLNGITPEQEVI